MTTVRVASFNLENFNEIGVRFAGRTDRAYDEAHYNAKKKWVAGILNESMADVVGFQEVFSVKALQDAVNASHLEGSRVMAPDIADGQNLATRADGTREAAGPHLGLVARLPVLEATTLADFPPHAIVTLPGATGAGPHPSLQVQRFERPVLKVRLALRDGLTATVLVAHLKSKRPKFLDGDDERDPVTRAVAQIRSLIIRSAEAVALRAIAVDLLSTPGGGPGEPLILLGDLNDDVPAVTTQVIAGERAPQFANAARKLAERDTYLYSAHDLEDERSLRNVSYTHIFNGRHELLDHIFVSQELIRWNQQRVGYLAGTRILNDHVLDERWRDSAPRIEGASPGRAPSLRSDHGIVVAEIRLDTQ